MIIALSVIAYLVVGYVFSRFVYVKIMEQHIGGGEAFFINLIWPVAVLAMVISYILYFASEGLSPLLNKIYGVNK